MQVQTSFENTAMSDFLCHKYPKDYTRNSESNTKNCFINPKEHQAKREAILKFPKYPCFPQAQLSQMQT